MRIPSVIAKSTLLATCIFWIIIISEDFQSDMIPFIFLSIIPIAICCSLTISLTIVPFFWFGNDTFNNGLEHGNKVIFKKYFPFYAMVSFGLCFYGIIKLVYGITISFFVSAFFTSLYAWVCFANE